MNIKLILKGFIVGIGKIIPGVSGSMLAMSLGIYEELLDAITNFFSDTKKHLKLLINFGIGLFIAIILFSKLILFLLNNYYSITMSLFLGLILGTVIRFGKSLTINKKNIILFVIFLSLTLILSLVDTGLTYEFNNSVLSYFYLILLGMIDAATSIIPGISGTAIFMLLGSYELVLSILSKPISLMFIMYALGLVIGIILVSYVMNYFLKKFKNATYAIILAFSLGSLVLVFMRMSGNFTIIGFFMLIIGVIFGYIFDK